MITGWNTSKIISWLVSLGCSVFALWKLNTWIYCKWNTSKFWLELGWGMEKVAFGV